MKPPERVSPRRWAGVHIVRNFHSPPCRINNLRGVSGEGVEGVEMAAEGQCVSQVDSISMWSQHPLWQYETAGESVSPTVGGSTLSETSARLSAESITCVEFLEKGWKG